MERAAGINYLQQGQTRGKVASNVYWRQSTPGVANSKCMRTSRLVAGILACASCAHAPPPPGSAPALGPVLPPDPTLVPEHLAKAHELVEAHRSQVERCVRKADPSLAWVGDESLILPRTEESRTTLRYAPAIVQSLSNCLEGLIRTWNLSDQTTNPQLAVSFQLLSNWSDSPSEGPEFKFTQLIALNNGRVVLSYETGYVRPPRRIGGKDPEYTQMALLESVRGTVVAKCMMTKEGQVKNCEAVQKLARLTDATLRALETRIYEPPYWNGQPFEATYWFQVNFQ